MNQSIKIMRARVAAGLLVMVAALASCTKTDEPTHPVGQKVAYNGAPTRTIRQLLDSLPDCTFFDSAYRHSGMGVWLDTLRAQAGVANSPYTLFVPTDNAFKAAGYSLQQIGQTSPAVLDTLLYYLTVQGTIIYRNLDSLRGNAVLNTLLTDPALQRSLPFNYNTSFTASSPYQYLLYAGVRNGTLWINGTAVKTAAQSLQATDGVIWRMDNLVLKPALETYQVLTQDTSYSMYMRAVRISDSIYQSRLNFSLRYFFSDTLGFQVAKGQAALTVLAPTNQAFRNAGFLNVNDLYTYIYGSNCVRNGGVDSKNRYIRTNLDSILDLHRIGYAPYSQFNNFYVNVVLYRNDMLFDPTVNNIVLWVAQSYNFPQTSVYTGVSFQNENGEVTVHRVDAPGGKAVHVVTPHDVYTLNGVVHRVDNLLTTTP